MYGAFVFTLFEASLVLSFWHIKNAMIITPTGIL